VVFNNGGIYHGDHPGEFPPSPTGLGPNDRYDKMTEAFGGVGYHAEDKASLAKALTEALAARRPALINCVIDPAAGTESGHITKLNPKSAVSQQSALSPGGEKSKYQASRAILAISFE